MSFSESMVTASEQWGPDLWSDNWCRISPYHKGKHLCSFYFNEGCDISSSADAETICKHHHLFSVSVQDVDNHSHPQLPATKYKQLFTLYHLSLSLLYFTFAQIYYSIRPTITVRRFIFFAIQRVAVKFRQSCLVFSLKFFIFPFRFPMPNSVELQLYF